MIRFCRIVGGLPIEFASGIREIKTLKFSTSGFLWGLILFILQEVFISIALFSYVMHRLDGKTLHSLNRTTDVAFTLYVVSRQVMVAVVFFSYVRKYQRFVDVFDTLERVYRDLQYKTSEVKATVKFWGICIVTATSVGISELMVHMIHDGVKVEQALLLVIQILSGLLFYCSQAALLVHFTHVTQSIAKFFRMVNGRIKKEIIINITERMEINHSQPKIDDIHTTRSIHSPLKELRTLMNTYWMLCDAVHQANVFYCDQLMFAMISSFTHVTISSYYFFLYIRVGNMFAVTNLSIWILSHVCYLVVLVNSSTDVTNSAEETSAMICKLINKGLDPVVKDQLEGFLLQLPHLNARFSALGYFPIHNKTLAMMVGAVTTYLVILIQFRSQPLTT